MEPKSPEDIYKTHLESHRKHLSGMKFLLLYSGKFSYSKYFVHWPMETFSTVQKFVHEHVADILKVRLRFLHKF